MIYDFDPDSMDVDTSGVSFYNEPTEIEVEGYQPFVYLTHYSTQWRAIHASSPDTEEIEIIASSISDALHWAVELARESVPHKASSASCFCGLSSVSKRLY
uniref:Uncharacterized protein n=1 Tax=Halorubrum lacusprofundi TaxID=2247 RepID=A0A218KRY4_9EURY|nr:hypothetical protein [Halorubrum lacusprofundi]AQM75310.1 hypothetical protein [Halorubrum lacusprofundi]